MPEMVRFAASPRPSRDGTGVGGAGGEPRPLLPLYYPIHEMGWEEEAMHRRMAREAPLDIRELSKMGEAEMEPPRDGLGDDGDRRRFRHWTISDYTSRYADGTITPSQVVDRIVRALEKVNEGGKRLSVVNHMNMEELRLEAARSTERYRDGNVMGVLDGVPILVKDEIPTAGFPATRGTSFLVLDHPVEKDSFPVLKLRRQGALVVGKTNQHEIGIGTTGFNLVNGTPRNPYGRDRGVHYYTGGSSSGSAAAVAAGLVPLAIGSDGGGSIRIPSSLCGVVGLKPTYKRVAVDRNCSVYHAGPMASNVHDAALAYAIMAGEADDDHRHQSRKQPPVHLHAYVTNARELDNPHSLKGLRIGIFQEHIEDGDDNVVGATKRAIEHYRSKGAEIVSITFPHLQEIHLAHAVTISTEMFSSMERHYRSERFAELSPETRISLSIGRSWSASEFLAAQMVRSYAMHHVEDLFENKVDVVLSPATPCRAPPLEEDVMSHGESDLAKTSTLMRYVIHGNLTGIPAMVFPVAYDEETGLPLSLQIQAAHWREDLLFRVARESRGILKDGVAKPDVYVNILGGEDNSDA